MGSGVGSGVAGHYGWTVTSVERVRGQKLLNLTIQMTTFIYSIKINSRAPFQSGFELNEIIIIMAQDLHHTSAAALSRTVGAAAHPTRST